MNFTDIIQRVVRRRSAALISSLISCQRLDSFFPLIAGANYPIQLKNNSNSPHTSVGTTSFSYRRSRTPKACRSLSFDEMCTVVTATVADINAPEDRYNLCASRKSVDASWLFTEYRHENRFPKGRTFRVILQADGGPARRANLKAEQFALLNAYLSLNNTIYEARNAEYLDFVRKLIDLYIPPVRGTAFMMPNIFASAQYSPAPLCFFTAMRSVSEISFIDSWYSLILLVATLLTYCGILTIYLNIRSRLFYRSEIRPNESRLWLFFVSTFFGKSLAPSLADAPTFRGLAVAV